jgi:hypothetical protein
LYSRWASWCCDELNYDERQQMFLASIHVMPTLKKAESVIEQPRAENVLSIFGE